MPLPAEDRQSFLLRLHSVREDPNFVRAGATWVPEKIWTLHYFAGFCAVDRKDWNSAQLPLETAVAMLPNQPMSRLELAHVYVSQKSPKKAIPHVRHVLDTAEDPCDLARAWRKLGFILFDLHEYAKAYEAYSTALRYEPGSVIAQKELKLLDQLMAKEGIDSGEVAKNIHHGPQQATTCTLKSY